MELSRQYDKTVRKRVFQNNWSDEFKWVLNDGVKIYCKTCRASYGDLAVSKLPDRGIFKKYSKGPFVVGCSNLKKSTLVDHQNSQGHKDSELHAENRKNPGQSVAEKSIEKINQVAFDRLKHLFRNAHAIAKFNRPFSDFTWMADLDERKGIVIGDTYRNDKACRAFIAAISSVELHRIKEDLSDVKFLTVISDGSTDVSVKEMEAVYLRYCHQGIPYTVFVCMQSTPKADADGIMNAITCALHKLETSESLKSQHRKVIAFAADGASVNTGKVNGVIAKMRQKWSPSIVMVQCLAHRLELTLKDAFKTEGPHEKLMSLLNNLYSFYHRSPLQRSGLQSSYEVFTR